MQIPVRREDWPALAAGGALALSVVSIAASQILLGAAILLTIKDWRRADYPKGPWLPVLFFVLTLAAVAASPLPMAGWPQVRKFYVYLIIPCLAAACTGQAFARHVLAAMGAGGALSALWSLIQYARRYSAAAESGQNFAQFYINDRITGFMSHWMTFAGTMMGVCLLASAYVLFHRPMRWRIAPLAVSTLLVINLAWTRGILIGACAGGLYLIWFWRRRLVLATPLLAAAAFLVMPEAEQARVKSILQARGEMDSNAHRVGLFWTGIEMIKDNPLLGVGPEQVKREFERYAPEEVPRPIPSHWFIGHLHNIYIQFAADRGLPAMLAIIGFLFWNLWAISRAAIAAPDETKWMLHGIAAFLVGLLVAGLFEHNLADSEVLMLTMGLVAMSTKLRLHPNEPA
jgi:putative inorganic carbon (hco3(-)) transporter